MYDGREHNTLQYQLLQTESNASRDPHHHTCNGIGSFNERIYTCTFIFSENLATAMSTLDWRARCEERKKKQLDEIPREWLIEPLPLDKRNVTNIPANCGLLTERELLITEIVDVDYLLRKLANGEWSSVEVTAAFYKRAIIAHQLVRPCSFVSYGRKDVLSPIQFRQIA